MNKVLIQFAHPAKTRSKMNKALLQLFIFLAAAAIAVPIAKRFGLGFALGCLIAGIAIGPFGLSLIDHVEGVMHFPTLRVMLIPMHSWLQLPN